MNDHKGSPVGLSSKTEEPILTPDQPISSLDHDYLGRGEFASRLARQLENYRGDQCLVVAFYAPWGAGKSSLLNLLATELAGDTDAGTRSPIVIRFNPWNFSSLDSLIAMFFRELELATGRSEPKLAKNVQKSLQALSFILEAGEISPVGGSSLGKASRISRRLSELIGKKSESLEAVKDKVNEVLRQLDRRIFVLIDDVDRLDQESMRYMFRLIRLNADFDRVTYVLAFDRRVVESVLTMEQEISGQEYLEKIVQVGFDIPPAEPSKLKQIFLESFCNLGFWAHDDEENNIRWTDLEGAGLYKLIRTPRDVVRYTNGLAVNGAIVLDEVNPVDFAAMEAIRTFTPELYAFIRENRDIVIGPTGGVVNIGVGNASEDRKQQFEDALSMCKSEMKDALRGVCRQLFPEIETSHSYSLHGDSYREVWRKAKRVCTVEFFPRYFYLRPSDEEVSQAEFEGIIGGAGDRAKLVAQLGELIDSGKIDNFLQRLADSSSEMLEEHIKSTVLSLFDVGDKLTTGLQFENQLLRASRAVHKLLLRQERPVRVSILRIAAKRATSLGAVAYFISLSSKSSQPEMELLDEENWNDIRNDLITRIKAAAEDLTLAESPHIAVLLYRWRDWGHIKDAQEFARRLTESDDGILTFLEGMMAQKSTTVGEYATLQGWYIPLDGVREFVDPNVLSGPVQRIRSERWDDLSDHQRAALDAFSTVLHSAS